MQLSACQVAGPRIPRNVLYRIASVAADLHLLQISLASILLNLIIIYSTMPQNKRSKSENSQGDLTDPESSEREPKRVRWDNENEVNESPEAINQEETESDDSEPEKVKPTLPSMR